MHLTNIAILSSAYMH